MYDDDDDDESVFWSIRLSKSDICLANICILFRNKNVQRGPAPWQNPDINHCDVEVKPNPPYDTGRRLLDLVDLSIFDFLIGNKDRHSIASFSKFDPNEHVAATFLVALDNGKGFGHPHDDDADILAPLKQCCIIRPSTVSRLLDFYTGKPTLAQQLEVLMDKDPIKPILAKKYLVAINRRLEIVLREVATCVRHKSIGEVLMNKFSFVETRKFTKGMRMINDIFVAEPGVEQTKQPTHKITKTRMLEPNNNAFIPTKRELLPQVVNADLVSSLASSLSPLVENDMPCLKEKSYKDSLFFKLKRKRDSWDEFHGEISSCHIYRKDIQTVQNLLTNMSTLEIKSIETFNDESQFKWKLTFVNGKHAIFKPKRFGRNYETNPDHLYFDDFERHHAEIAAFHLDRLLGFRRVVPSVGRILRIEEDLLAKSTPLIKFYHIPTTDHDKRYDAICIYGDCKIYCDVGHAICSDKDTPIIEGSVQVWLPLFEGTQIESPYKKSYSEIDNIFEIRQIDDEFCDSSLKSQDEYKKGRRLLDLIDLYIFDYITGNLDRQYYKTFSFRGQKSKTYIYITENAKAFGNPREDSLTQSILAPLTQCCVVRPSTVNTLLNFYNGTSLGTELDRSLTTDPLYPILATKYLEAVDRRVKIVLEKDKLCLDKHGANKVLINQYDHNANAPNIRTKMLWGNAKLENVNQSDEAIEI